MYNVMHISMECHPAVKVGGLADVVGALPKHLIKKNIPSSVIIPYYDNIWMNNAKKEIIHNISIKIGDKIYETHILKLSSDSIPYSLYAVSNSTFFDTKGVYIDPDTQTPYPNEFDRFLLFQLAVLEMLLIEKPKKLILHCHDHHTALIPYFLKHIQRYNTLNHPTILTIHNVSYLGIYSEPQYHNLTSIIDKSHLPTKNNILRTLEMGIKHADIITTVSKQYIDEIKLIPLFQEDGCNKNIYGILNGIETDIWNPNHDKNISYNYTDSTISIGKKKNKELLCKSMNLDNTLPLVTFIGRLVYDKGVDNIPAIFSAFFQKENPWQLIVLGTGMPELEQQLITFQKSFPQHCRIILKYDEKLAHQLYSASDFLFMPSRKEPCGLNQMYALRYGTIPIVYATGGLKESIVEYDAPNGNGILCYKYDIKSWIDTLKIAHNLYYNKEEFHNLRQNIMAVNNSWEHVIDQYIALYQKLKS